MSDMETDIVNLVYDECFLQAKYKYTITIKG